MPIILIDQSVTFLKHNLTIMFIVFFAIFTNTVHAQIQFDLNSTKLTPFPSNLFSVPDERQLSTHFKLVIVTLLFSLLLVSCKKAEFD